MGLRVSCDFFEQSSLFAARCFGWYAVPCEKRRTQFASPRLQLAESFFEDRKLCSSQLPNATTGCASGVPFAEDVCQFSHREADRQPGPNHSHSSETIWQKHAVASGSSGGWRQEIPPLVETDSVRAYAGKTGQFSAIQGSSCRNFGTHRISLRLGINSKVKQILTLRHICGKGLMKP